MELVLQSKNDGYCVPYSLVSILKYYGITVPKATLVKRLCKSKNSGANLREATQVLYGFGLILKEIPFTYSSVAKSINEKAPVVLTYMSGKESHFSTITECREDSRGLDYYTLNDTYHGVFEMPGEILKALTQQDEGWIRKVVRKK